MSCTKSLHHYQYSYSNPVLFTDPTGKAVVFLSYRPAFQGEYHVAVVIDDNSSRDCPKPKDDMPYRPCNGQAATIIEAGPEISDDRLTMRERILGLLHIGQPWGRINVRPGIRPGSRGSDIGPQELADPKYIGTKKVIVDDDKPTGAYTTAMFAYVERVEDANIPYHPTDRNSNAVASGALQAAGIPINIAHPHSVPGWGKDVFPIDLSRYKLIFPFTIPCPENTL